MLMLNNLFKKYVSFLGKFIPRPPQLPVIGIDIGTSAVKAVQIIAHQGGDLELGAWGVERIENGNIKAALQKLQTKVNFIGNVVTVTSVSGKGTLIRYVDMPIMPLEDLRKSFVFELDKYFPFDPQTIYMDCAILEQKPKEKKMAVLVVAVKKEIVDERIALFKELGVSLSRVTVNSLAVANAFERLGPVNVSTDKAKAILDFGGSVSSLLVVKDLSARFTRDIFIGSHEITQQIANILGVDAQKAENLKHDPAALQKPEVQEACEAAVSNLVAEIRLSLDYFMTERNILIDELYLFGGGSLIAGIETIIAKQIGITVKRWDPLTDLKLSPAVAATDVKNYSTQLGAAIGLGLVKA